MISVIRDGSFQEMKWIYELQREYNFYFSGRELPMESEGIDGSFQEMKWTMN
jgi:hypothetical protein